MKFPAPVSVKWIAELIHAEVAGNATATTNGINEIHKVERGDIVFVDHPKYYDKCLNSESSCIIINTKEVSIPEGKTILIVTHEPDIAAMCKRNVVLKDGIIIDDKFVEQVRASSYV